MRQPRDGKTCVPPSTQQRRPTPGTIRGTTMMMLLSTAINSRMLSIVHSRVPYRLVVVGNDASNRFFSSNNSALPFRPRRRPPPDYRPLKPRPVKVKGPLDPHIIENQLDKTIELGNVKDASDELEEIYGPHAADAIRHTRKVRDERGGQPLDPEELLKMADYITAEAGSTEDLVGQRRALALDGWDDEEGEDFLKEVEEFIEKERIASLELDDLEEDNPDTGKRDNDKEDEEDPKDQRDVNRFAYGDWGETIVRVDRVNKVQRGGTMVRYRCLVIGGNTQGCAGFGIGKAHSPREATYIALKMCKRNIFFVDRYQGAGLSRDLVGKHNSCRVTLRAVEPNQGLNGHPLVMDIMTYFGVTDCISKSHGNRNIYNVVRATFKAIMTHESMEEIALKRGKRLLNVERAARLQI